MYFLRRTFAVSPKFLLLFIRCVCVCVFVGWLFYFILFFVLRKNLFSEKINQINYHSMMLDACRCRYDRHAS